MANHVTNILTVKGATKQLKEVLSILLDEEGNVDFNKALPIPMELEGTQCPTIIISSSDYQEQEEKITNGENVFTRGITRKMSKELIEKFGFDNWYDWQLNVWGTKWNAYNQKELRDNSFQFETAWATPSNFVQNFSKMFPEVTFEMKYADEDMGYNVGKYHLKNGEYIFTELPEGGSVDAYKLALELHGGADSWMLNKLFEDLEEDELAKAIQSAKDRSSSFEAMAVRLVYEFEISNDNYPIVLSQYLLERAVENENYSYANKIKNSISNVIETTNNMVDLVVFEKEILQVITFKKLEKFEIYLSRLLKLQKSLLESYNEAENKGLDVFEKIFNTQELIKRIQSNLLMVREVMLEKQFINN